MINLLSNYPLLLQNFIENGNKSVSSNIFGYNELNDLIEESYNYFLSDINGFKGEEKTKKLKNIFNEFPISLICNGLILIIIVIFYTIFIIRINNIELYFLEKLINFHTPNFDNFLKKLEELKKKFRNDTSEDEDKEDGENDGDSKKVTTKRMKMQTKKMKCKELERFLKKIKKQKKKMEINKNTKKIK